MVQVLRLHHLGQVFQEGQLVQLVLLLPERLSIRDIRWTLGGPRSRVLQEGQEVREVPQQVELVGEVEGVDNISLRLKMVEKTSHVSIFRKL